VKLLIINGPNINMLGVREKNVYGTKTYQDLIDYIADYCAQEKQESITAVFFQSNHEGAIVDEIQGAYQKYDGLVINPAAYTHTSVAILDALKAVAIPAVEVHISDVDNREEFRKHSYIRSACIETFSGFGFDGYIMAVKRLQKHYRESK
jgi:3-dehydroquinate dehydratase-2